MMQYLLRYKMAAYLCLSLTSRPSPDSLPFYISTNIASSAFLTVRSAQSAPVCLKLALLRQMGAFGGQEGA